MKKLSLIAALALAGCGWDMDVHSWRRAEALCQPHGGLLAANVTGGRRFFFIEAFCGDGATVEANYSVERSK